MKISLLTDAPKHNLALMKISAWHKANGNQVTLNMPLWKADKTYASILFKWNRESFIAQECGGPGFDPLSKLDSIGIDGNVMPDYSLFNLDYSLGYTYRNCFRNCAFCLVGMMNENNDHHSIWEFHDPKFKKICLLNNNTFFDKGWLTTFEEIWDAHLTVVDENGYDLRLLDDEKAAALRKTKWDGQVHFAWDRIQDEKEILRGLELLKKWKIRNAFVYVLIGYDTTQEDDFYRCQKIIDYGFDPYPMPYHQNEQEKMFKRFMNTFMWRKYKTLKEAWANYK
jgi:hypothetical protein